MDITPAEERGIFPARVELGEPFEMTAQVFIEGRTKVGATAIVRNPRGKETMRRAMTCVNPGLDRWTVMVKCGEHSDLKPWEDGYAAVKRQLGEWTVTIEGWEDAYVSWLHDARIKVRVMDDVDNALNSGAELLARWAETPDTGLTARDRKTLEKAAETMADQTLSAEDRLAAHAGDDHRVGLAALQLLHPVGEPGLDPVRKTMLLHMLPRARQRALPHVHGQGADSRAVFHQVNGNVAVICPYISNFASFGDKGSNGFKSF